jgi:hypothetical protein
MTISIITPVEPPSVALQPVASINIGDIANYAYIWFNKSNPSETITEKEKDFIHDTITKGTFPTYLQKYSDDERQALFTNEIEFVRQKFTDANLSHITILQIPRILYDLFNLFSFYHTHPGERAQFDETIHLKCETNTEKLEDYISYINEEIEYFKDKIFKLNDSIIHFLNAHNFLDSINIVNNYKNILELIMSDINKIYRSERELPFGHIDTDKRITILHGVLELESQFTSNSILLYRGAKLKNDSTIEMKWSPIGLRIQYPSSLSLNLSILSGCIEDPTACSLYYIDKPNISITGENNKIKYTIKKFMFGDKSLEDSLFFIPPIPPYLQLYCHGELWHPRTKIGNDSPDMTAEKIHPKGLFCSGYDFNKKFTYLQSDKSMAQLEEMYQLYKKNGNVENWRKYVKYKTKYLELKNRLGK